jgi:Fe-S-cluster containining protein
VNSPKSSVLLAQLEALYQQVDAALQGWTCQASTLCCRFGITGREPYVTSIELALIERQLASRGGGLPTRRRALPLARDTVEQFGQRWRKEERTCPLLDSSGRCFVYACRPFGCRTFFCDNSLKSKHISRERIRQWVAEIERLAHHYCPDGDKGRPLTRALRVG